jgi:hypothetical protein
MSEQDTATDVPQFGGDFRRPWVMFGGTLLAGGIAVNALNDLTTLTGLTERDGVLAGIGGLSLTAGLFVSLYGVLDKVRFSRGKAVKPQPRLRMVLLGLIGLAVVLMLLSMVVTAASVAPQAESDAAAVEPSVLQSTDGFCEMTVPSAWRPNEDLAALQPPPAMQVTDPTGNIALIVRHEAKIDLRPMTLDEYTNLNIKGLVDVLSDSTQSRVVNLQLGRYVARTVEITGTEGDNRVTYRLATIEAPKRYFVILGWSAPSHADDVRSTFDTIISRFRVVNSLR